jgi:hypothetical protein
MVNEQQSAEFTRAVNELRAWLKLAYWGTVRSRIEGILDDPKKLMAYEATDGAASTRDVGKQVGVDQKTVSNWWREWLQEGIVEPGPERADRPVRLISLKEFGLL